MHPVPSIPNPSSQREEGNLVPEFHRPGSNLQLANNAFADVASKGLGDDDASVGLLECFQNRRK